MLICALLFAVPASVIAINFRFSVARNLEDINPDVVESSLVSLETQVCGKTIFSQPVHYYI